jgi:tetraacyldisaccharide-1-P 4'-kinase
MATLELRQRYNFVVGGDGKAVLRMALEKVARVVEGRWWMVSRGQGQVVRC